MFQIDEKVIKDSRTLITINQDKANIDPITKNGTLNYVSTDKTMWLTTPKVRSAYTNRLDHTSELDKVVLARNGMNIDGAYQFDDPIMFSDNVEIKKDLLIRGNFTVEGTASVIDTPRLTIEDNVIELNRNESGNGITLKHAGTAINRGTRDYARYLFEDTKQAFVLDTNPNMDGEVLSDKWVAMGYTNTSGDYMPGEFVARYRLTAPNGKFTNGLFVGGSANINTLNVTGDTTLSGAFTANGNNTFNAPVTNNNTTTLNGILTANDRATFKKAVSMEDTLAVNGASSFKSEATLELGVTIKDHANIYGATHIFNSLAVDQNASFNRDVSVTSQTSTNTLTTAGLASLNSLLVSSNATINNNATVKNSFTVEGSSTVKGLTALENFTVNGISRFKNDATFENVNVSILSSQDTNGILTVGGNAVLNKTLSVAGAATFNQAIRANEAVTVYDALTANSIMSEGDISVIPDTDKGYRFGNSDNHKIYLGLTSSHGRLDSTSDKNMYFKISGGTNRGFAFKFENTMLAQIDSTGKMQVVSDIYSKGSRVLTKANEGHQTDSSIGVSADRLDDLHASSFLRSDANSILAANKVLHLGSIASSIHADAENNVFVKSENTITIQANTNSNASIDKCVNIKTSTSEGLKVMDSDLTFNGNTVWHKGNDGSSSGLDADLLDGKHASDFAESTHNHDEKYVSKDEVNLQSKYQIQYNSQADSLDFIYVG